MSNSKQIMYSETQLKDEIDKAIKEKNTNQMLEFAQMLQNTVSNNFIVAQKKNLFSIQFTQENVQQYLESPQKYEKELRSLSLVLSTLSPQYQQIVNYFSSIAKFMPIVVPNVDRFSNAKGEISDVDKIRKEYLKVISHIEKLNIPHEFQRITAIATRDDVFYGYIHETKDSFYIQQLDSDYCRISSISDGVYNFQFNFEYFDKNKSIKGISDELVKTYPMEFQEKYNLYQRDKRGYQWQELSEDTTICIKFLEELPFAFPPYSSLFNDLADLSQYKELTKTKTKVDNYKFIGMEIPLGKENGKEDNFLVSTTTALTFYNLLLNNLPEGIGAFLSATPFKDINFGSGAMTDKDQVDRAENNVFTSSGISPINFGKGANNSSTVKFSNLGDSARLFKVYRQLERWLNRKFKKEYNGRFVVELLDVTIFTLQDTIDQYLKLAQYGVPVKLQLASLMGVNQSKERGLTFLEDNILDLSNEWKPLQSTHTQSGEVGATPKDDSEIADSTANNRNNDSTENR